jgi:pimeloyl-ACP methyl ester carboxylesterase
MSFYQQFLATYPLQQQQIEGYCWEYIDTEVGDEVLLLLPGGFGVAQTSWQYILAFATRYRVLSLHYPAGNALLNPLCAQLIRLLDTLQIPRVHVLGGSASGAVAQVLARYAPARITSLILAQTGPPQPQRAAMARRLARAIECAPLWLSKALLHTAIWGFLPCATESHRRWRSHFRSIVTSQSRASLANRFHLLADYDTHYTFAANDLAGWPGRVAIIESANDGFVPAAQQQALRNLYPRAWVYTFPQGSHGLSLHNPAAQIAVIARFLGAGFGPTPAPVHAPMPTRVRPCIGGGSTRHQ